MFSRPFVVRVLMLLCLTLLIAASHDGDKTKGAAGRGKQKKSKAGHKEMSKCPQDNCENDAKCPAQFKLQEDSTDYIYPGDNSYLSVYNAPMYTSCDRNNSYSSNIGYCILTDNPNATIASSDGISLCSWTFFINQDQNYQSFRNKKCSGTISAQGPFRLTERVNYGVITGGSGAYLAVQGTVSYTLINDTKKCLPLTNNLPGVWAPNCPDYEFEFNLIYPSKKLNA